jgi:sortase A
MTDVETWERAPERARPPDPLPVATAPSAPPVVDTPPMRHVPRSYVPSRADVGAIVNGGLITFAVAILAFGLFLTVPSSLQHGRDQTGLTRRFRSELINERALVGGPIPSGSPVAMIDIAAIGVHEVVVQGTTSAVTRSGPGHLAASVMPGQVGNAVIVGRRLAFGGPFRKLGSLHTGDEIRVTTGQGTARYAIVSEKSEPPGNARAMLPTGGNRLTLVTSDPAVFTSRYLVAVARLETTPFAATGHAQTIGRSELGLTGDTSSLPTMFVWLLFAALVGAASVVLFRRMRRATAWLVVLPLVLVAAWLVFENLVVLLPASL